MATWSPRDSLLSLARTFPQAATVVWALPSDAQGLVVSHARMLPIHRRAEDVTFAGLPALTVFILS